MKYKLKFSIFTSIFLLLFIIMTVFAGCEKDKIDDYTTETLNISVDNPNPLPYEIVKIAVEGLSLSSENYNIKIGDLTVIALRQSSDTLIFMTPFLSSSTYKLTLDIDGQQGSTDLNIKEQTPVTNQTDLLNGVIYGANNTLTRLEDIAVLMGQTINDDDKTLINNMVNSFNNVYAQLTEDDKYQFAQFINTNPEIFTNVDFPTLKDNARFLVFSYYLKNQLVPVSVSAAASYLFLSTPDLTLSKVIGIGSFIYLVSKLNEIAMRTDAFLAKTVIPEISELGTNKKSTDLTFVNNQQKSLNISIVYRTIFEGDLSTTNPDLKLLIAYLDQFQLVWSKVDGLINTLKNLFGFSDGSLTGRPAKISEIASYQTSYEPGLSVNATITGITNPKVTVSVVNEGSQIKATFSTSETTDQIFNFTYRYTDGNFTFEKLYSADLVENNDTIALLTNGSSKTWTLIYFNGQLLPLENWSYDYYTFNIDGTYYRTGSDTKGPGGSWEVYTDYGYISEIIPWITEISSEILKWDGHVFIPL